MTRAGRKVAGLVILSYLPYPSRCGLSRRIDGIKEVLETFLDKIVVVCPSFGSPIRQDPRVDLIKIPVSLDRGSIASRFLVLLLYSLLGLAKTVRYAASGYLIQYESIFSALPALLTKVFLRKTVIGDDLSLLYTRSPFLSSILYMAEAVSAKSTDHCITASTKALPFLKRFSKNLLYIQNGVKVSESGEEHMRDETTLLFVGALTFDQNRIAINKIFKISSFLASIRPEASIIVVGGPETLAAPLRNHELAKAGRMRFLGEVSDDELKRIYSRAFIGLLPFFSDTPNRGGARIKALEYFAHGLLVVSGTEGVVGIGGLRAGEHFLAAASVEEMCSILERCLTDPESYYAIARAGKERVSVSCSWKTVTKDYVKLVKYLLEKSDLKIATWSTS